MKNEISTDKIKIKQFQTIPTFGSGMSLGLIKSENDPTRDSNVMFDRGRMNGWHVCFLRS